MCEEASAAFGTRPKFVLLVSIILGYNFGPSIIDNKHCTMGEYRGQDFIWYVDC